MTPARWLATCAYWTTDKGGRESFNEDSFGWPPATSAAPPARLSEDTPLPLTLPKRVAGVHQTPERLELGGRLRAIDAFKPVGRS